MSRLGQIRRSPRLIRSVFAAFVLAWLQMALVPCVMAGTMPARVASAQAAETTVHAGMDHSGMGHEAPDLAMPEAQEHHDCVYCPPAAAQGHGTSPANCAYPDQGQADGQVSQLQFGHGVLSIVPDLRSFEPVIQRHFIQTLVHAAPPLPRPLTLTYCVQLK